MNEQEQKAFQMYGKLPQKNLLSKINKVSILGRCGRVTGTTAEPVLCCILRPSHRLSCLDFRWPASLSPTGWPDDAQSR